MSAARVPNVATSRRVSGDVVEDGVRSAAASIALAASILAKAGYPSLISNVSWFYNVTSSDPVHALQLGSSAGALFAG